jgi:hypothetical protein
MDSPYKLWTTEDGQTHAFYRPEQTEHLGYVEAICGHTVPPDQLDKTKVGLLCTDCVVALNTVLPDVGHRTPP